MRPPRRTFRAAGRDAGAVQPGTRQNRQATPGPQNQCSRRQDQKALIQSSQTALSNQDKDRRITRRPDESRKEQAKKKSSLGSFFNDLHTRNQQRPFLA